MRLEIYDGQHGTILFPYTNHVENKKIKRFFNEKIELYIEKDSNITVYCKMHALKTADRVEVFYIVYSDMYNEEYFLHFKNEVENALNNMGLKLVFNKDSDNIILRNIHIFNEKSSGIPSFKEFDDVIHILNKRRHVELKAGKISDIIVFCKKLLKSSNNINISISTGDTIADEGDINILLDNNFETPLTLTDKTKKILYDYKKEIEKNRNDQIIKEKEEEAIKKIKEGAVLIKDGISIIEKIGRNAKEIVTKELNFDKKIFGDKNGSKVDIVIRTGSIHIIVIIGIIMFILGILVGPSISSFLLDKGIISIPADTETPIPTDIAGSIPTDTLVPDNTKKLIPNNTKNDTAIPTQTSMPNVTK